MSRVTHPDLTPIPGKTAHLPSCGLLAVQAVRVVHAHVHAPPALREHWFVVACLRVSDDSTDLHKC